MYHKNRLVVNSCVPKIKKNSKGIAAATVMFHQHLLKMFPALCCSLCHVFVSPSRQSRISAGQTFPLVLPTLLNFPGQPRMDFNITGVDHSLESRKTCIGLPRRLVFHNAEVRVARFKSVVKIPAWRWTCSTVTECDEAKLARSYVWIVAPGSEALLNTVTAEKLAFLFMSRSFASLQHLHLERGTRRCRGRRWKTKEKMGWS